jgi:hypothetical protein
MAIGLEGHTVSLTKNGYFKLIELIQKYPSTEILSNLSEIKLDYTQARKMLAGDKNGVLPIVWDSVRPLDPTAQYALLLVSIIFSHKTLIALFKKSTNSEMQGVINRADSDTKTYTNIAFALNEAGVATDFTNGADKTSYDFSPILAKNEIGPLAKEILKGHLENMGWSVPSLAEPFQRDFYEQLNSYDFSKVLGLSFDQFKEWLEGDNVVKTISSVTSVDAKNKIYFGAPGTGKSYNVDKIVKEIDNKYWERITFHPEFDYASFVGSYKPYSITVKNKSGEDQDEIKYKFVPQSFANIYVRAWEDVSNDKQYYLIIEEINRGNCSEIFGDIFQLLDRHSNYTVTPSKELKDHLLEALDKDHEGIKDGLKLPPNLSVLATMNTSDQSLFPMDSAFKRRWEWEYTPINYERNYPDDTENKSYDYVLVNDDDTVMFRWIDFIKTVNSIIKANPNLGMDKCIGNFFVQPVDGKKITLPLFVNKVIFYLWNDVFKDEEEYDTIFPTGTFYEDFFPIKVNGFTMINEIIQKINGIAESEKFAKIELNK